MMFEGLMATCLTLRIIISAMKNSGEASHRRMLHPWKLTAGSPENHPIEIRKIIFQQNPHDFGEKAAKFSRV